MDIEFNMNETVKVQLTEHGHKIMKANHDKCFAHTKEPFAFKRRKEDDEGWSEWQLWCLFREFGEHTTMGLAPCFSNNIVLVTKSK